MKYKMVVGGMLLGMLVSGCTTTTAPEEDYGMVPRCMIDTLAIERSLNDGDGMESNNL